MLLQDNTCMFSHRRATTTCASMRAAVLFIDAKRLVGDDTFSDLVMVEARHLFRRSSWRHWSWPAAARYGGCSKPYGSFYIF